MSITRRQFLKRSAAATAGAMLGPGLFGSPLVRRAFAETIGDRYLVVFFLDGGNDALNSLIPIDDVAGFRTAYETHRTTGFGGLRIDAGQMAMPAAPLLDPATGTSLGFHPALASLRTMYDAGRVAIIQGTGYPDYSLSHNESSKIWKTGNPAGVPLLNATGWAGRHLALEYGSTVSPAVAIGASLPGEFIQIGTNVLVIDGLADFGFPFDDYDESEILPAAIAFNTMHAAAAGDPQPTSAFLGAAGNALQDGTRWYPALVDAYDADRQAFSTQYAAINDRVAFDLRDIATIIYGVESSATGVDARFFQLTQPGYDTHADQGAVGAGSQHHSLLEPTADAIKVFFDDLADMGVADRTTMVIWSEFGRRVPQNSNGTDHGSQGQIFVIGDAVAGGIYGNHPNIVTAALDGQGNTPYSQAAGTFRSTDFRDVYGTLLKHWVNMDEADILSGVLPLDTGDPATYWTANDFDLGFI